MKNIFLTKLHDTKSILKISCVSEGFQDCSGVGLNVTFTSSQDQTVNTPKIKSNQPE